MMPFEAANLAELNSIDRLNAIVDHLKSIRPSKRAGIMEIVKRGLHERGRARLKFAWPLYARDSQLPPEGDWDTWLILAGRGFGKTRAGATTTPKPIELIRDLPNSPGVHVTRGSTYDNQDNLAPSFFNAIIERYDGTRLGQQEIHAELIDED